MKRFKLECGTVIKVDDEDAYLLRGKVWRSYKGKYGGLYIRSSANATAYGQTLSHVVTNAPDGSVVVFLNADECDLRKENLLVLKKHEFSAWMNYCRHDGNDGTVESFRAWQAARARVCTDGGNNDQVRGGCRVWEAM